jgi:hypothetical protein
MENKYCCEQMKNNITTSSVTPDDLIVYSQKFDEYGIPVRDGGHSYVCIDYCPWCGMQLPNSKRDLWFEKLRSLGYENPLEDEIPKEFKTNKWYTDTNNKK